MIKVIQRLGLISLCLFAGVVSFLFLLFHALPFIGSEQRFWSIAIGFNSTGNATLGGCPYETFSARTYRNNWRWREKFINFLFSDPYHCRTAFMNEVYRKAKTVDEYRAANREIIDVFAMRACPCEPDLPRSIIDGAKDES